MCLFFVVFVFVSRTNVTVWEAVAIDLSWHGRLVYRLNEAVRQSFSFVSNNEGDLVLFLLVVVVAYTDTINGLDRLRKIIIYD